MCIGILIVQIFIIKIQIEISLYLYKNRRKEIKKVKEQKFEKEKALSDYPKWAEDFINNYMANSEKSNHQ